MSTPVVSDPNEKRRQNRRGRAAFPVIAIGASAGGLEALEQFFAHTRVGSGAAFVVIQHLDPDHKGMMPELLQRFTQLPVVQAENLMKVHPDNIYVIPPNSDLSILHDRLYLMEPAERRGLRLPIDFFFRALADDRRETAVGVLLSGMGSDGTLGAAAIKQHGGLVLVQDPATAKFDGMPRSAVDSGQVDIVAPTAELPARIERCLQQPARMSADVDMDKNESETHKSALDKVCIVLRAKTGHDFSLYKRSTLYRRIERRMAIHQLPHIADYVRYLRENSQEIDLLFRELLIGVTNFFRDPAVWACLQQEALQQLVANAPEGAVLRAWVAGCSTGEEAYSLAISFREVQERLERRGRCSLQIFATDLTPDAIERARRGVYPPNIVADVTPDRLQRYFIDEGNSFRISQEIREMVVFAPHNVISDPPFTKLDLLSCRNLLIYLGAALQKKLLPLFHYSLKPGGILLLGSAETIGNFTDLFSPIEAKHRLFRRNDMQMRALDVEFPTRHFPTPFISAMTNKPEPTALSLQQAAEEMLLQNFSPAAVLVNSTGDLLYISGRTGRYLEPAAGKANWNIHVMARGGLRHEISLALPEALRTHQRVTRPGIEVSSDGQTRLIDLTVQPIDEPATLRGMAMILFADVALPAGNAVPAGTRRRKGSAQQQTELEKLLTHRQQELGRLREEMQTSQEELKSANEELQSTNEELQSTNEELTTSKEEMQSLNEELQTVNLELQSKVDELSAANNDMKNLLNSTDIATIFLDNALHVRRFTDQAKRLFKLIAGDVGRPLSDIVTDLAYPDLLKDAAEVLRTLAFSDKEVTTVDGRWYQVKIMPYRTLNNVIDGVVITFNDIGHAKRLEAELRKLAKPAGGVP